jgi:hypothetical protein
MLTQRTPEARLVWIVLALGALLPWCVVIGVKLYLDFHGSPTWGWRHFLHPGIVLAEIWTTVCLAAPSMVLAIFALQLFSGRLKWLNMLSRLEKASVIAACAAWGAVGSVPVFVEMFREFHPVSFFFPFFWTALYIDDYALGLRTRERPTRRFPSGLSMSSGDRWDCQETPESPGRQCDHRA